MRRPEHRTVEQRENVAIVVDTDQEYGWCTVPPREVQGVRTGESRVGVDEAEGIDWGIGVDTP